ncbi:serine hydrolase domain-containing protein [Tunturibacter empetritectus]|uniref:Serine hydrolase domain-containing protein n=1 Tax=Tunturiibacter empetritectus TaxID=3069691 RepID=A0AAU7Z8S8_9BACT
MLLQTQAQQPAATTATQAHISRIQNGLLPSVVIKGHPAPVMKLADRMRYYHVPGISIAYFDHERIEWTHVYGVADIQRNRPVTTETLFQAGSISKPIAALGALKLVQRGKLKLDENVNDELTSWKLPDNEFTANQKVTLRMLLSHSGGVSVHGFGGYEVNRPLPSVAQILDGAKPANSAPVRVAAVPGSVYSYSGGGMIVTQLMMMEATGKSFPALMNDLVLSPIGMSHSTYEQPLPPSLLSSAAHGYGPNGEPLPGGFHIYPEMAAAGLWATPSDLARAAIEVQQEYAGNSHKVLSQALAEEMLTRQKDNWGLGFEVEKPGATPRFDHFGVNTGFISVLEAYRDRGQGIVIMTNGQQGEKLITEILRAVAHEYAWPDFQPAEHTLIKLDPTSFKDLEGTYDQADRDGQDKFTVTIRDGRPYISGTYSVGSTYHFGLSEPVELLPESEQQYFTLLTGGASFRFEKTSDGIVNRCVVISGTNQREAKKWVR